MAEVNLTLEKLRQLLSYDPETGVFRWIAPLSNRAKAGEVAGSSVQGYISIGLLGRNWQAHRLAWLYVNGTLPVGDIDHKNGDRSDNRIENLRDVSRLVNLQNRRIGIGRSGLIGAHGDHKGKWRSSIRAAGKLMHLGNFDTAEQAHEAYLAAKRRLHEGCTI